MSDSAPKASLPAAKSTQVQGPLDVTAGGLRVLDAVLEKHRLTKVRIAVEGIERISLSDFESIDEMLSSNDLLAISLTRLEFRCKTASGDRSVAITLGGRSSGEVSVHAPSLEDAGKLLNEMEATLGAMRSVRRWPHNPLIKYPIGIIIYLGALFLVAKVIFFTLGTVDQANALAVWFLAGVPLWYLADVYKLAFPNPRFFIGKQPVPPKWALVLLGTLALNLVYDLALKPFLHWASLWPSFAN